MKCHGITCMAEYISLATLYIYIVWGETYTWELWSIKAGGSFGNWVGNIKCTYSNRALRSLFTCKQESSSTERTMQQIEQVIKTLFFLSSASSALANYLLSYHMRLNNSSFNRLDLGSITESKFTQPIATGQEIWNYYSMNFFWIIHFSTPHYTVWP